MGIEATTGIVGEGSLARPIFLRPPKRRKAPPSMAPPKTASPAKSSQGILLFCVGVTGSASAW